MTGAGARWSGTRVAGAALLVLLALATAWLALRAAAVRTLPPGTPALATVAPDQPDGLLTAAMLTAETGRGSLDAPVLAAVGRAAQRLPLDDRPFFLFGLRAIATGDAARGLRLLEQARRRDPRNRLARLVLMDRYLRDGDIAAATSEMTVLARLLPGSGEVLTRELARLAETPATAAPVRRALRADPVLFSQVLATMARGGAAPAAVLRFAGDDAPPGLETDGWRRALIDARTAAGDYAGARALWARAYRISPADAAAPVFDAGFRRHPAPPPFNWATVGSDVGAATIGGGTLAAEFYGRRSGELASQLLTLAPGDYALGFAIEGIDSGDSSGVGWSVTCNGGAAEALLATPKIRISPTARRVSTRFTVPAMGCPAQWLRLVGTAGEFAAATQARIRDLVLVPTT